MNYIHIYSDVVQGVFLPIKPLYFSLPFVLFEGSSWMFDPMSESGVEVEMCGKINTIEIHFTGQLAFTGKGKLYSFLVLGGQSESIL